MLVMGYYGLLRIGEMTLCELDHMIRFDNVHFGQNKRKVVLVLRSSKTHSFNAAPQVVKITGVKEKPDKHFQDIPKYCPVNILLSFLDAHGNPKTKDESFFIFRDRLPVKPDNFRTVLKQCLKMAGLDKTKYDTHSLCIGQAMDLQRMGFTVEQIKKSGRWKSILVFNYLKTC